MLHKIVLMVIVGWIPLPDGTLKETWRIERKVTLEHCLIMNSFSGGGKAGAVTVRCTDDKLAHDLLNGPKPPTFMCGLRTFFHLDCEQGEQ